MLDTTLTRRHAYLLLIVVAGAGVAGRILSVNNVAEPNIHRTENDPPEKGRAWPPKRPAPVATLGGNDRSRWATVRALVDNGTYVIGERQPTSDPRTFADQGITFEDGWGTLDKVLHPDTNQFYSSKPPLLPTLVAGEYWLLKQLFGWSITGDHFAVVRAVLLTVNAAPFVLYLILLARLAEQLGATDWGRLYVVTAGAFGTLASTFLITFNNHTVATFSALFALYPAVQILKGCARPGYFLLAGFFAGFAAVNELPAAAFAAGLCLVLLVQAPRRTLTLYLPALLLPAAALLATNYLAVGTVTPVYEKFGSVWYEYEGSPWKPDPVKPKRGIDWAYLREGTGAYAFHVLLGHHGLFSLSPIWILALLGAGLALRQPAPPGEGEAGGPRARSPLFWVGLMALGLTVIVLGFYLFGVNPRTHNYGGWTAGLRWLMWLTPFWLLSLLPAADWLAGRRWGRAVAYLCLAASVLAVTYPAWNPWRHPWIYNWMDARGWIEY